MINRTPHDFIMIMKRLLTCLTLLAAAPALIAEDAIDTPGALAQNTAAPANPPSGMLTPPPDTAPAASPAPAAPAPSAPAAAPTPAPPTPGVYNNAGSGRPSVAQIRREEIVRRQELVYRADQAMTDGRKAEVGLNYPEARKQYLFAAEAYGTISRATQSYSTAAEGLTRVDFKLYDDACAFGDTTRAKLLVEEVLKYNPNNPEAAKRMAAIDRALNNPNDTSILGNPAVTPHFIDKVNRVQELFAEAEQFRRTGQWDEATERLREILAIDKYNIAATKQLERIDKEEWDYDEHARNIGTKKSPTRAKTRRPRPASQKSSAKPISRWKRTCTIFSSPSISTTRRSKKRPTSSAWKASVSTRITRASTSSFSPRPLPPPNPLRLR
jgi:hypothetical protein